MMQRNMLKNQDYRICQLRINCIGISICPFIEDACRARRGYTALNLSTIRKLATQIIKEHVDKSSLKKRRFKASLSNDYLTDLLLNANF